MQPDVRAYILYFVFVVIFCMFEGSDCGRVARVHRAVHVTYT